MTDTPHDPETGEIIEPVRVWPRMPPEIAKAIVTVMKDVQRLGYDEKNKFQSYDYVSIDKFLDVYGKKLADAGLFVMTEELKVGSREQTTTDDRGNVKKSHWLTMLYGVMLYHESGVSFGPVERNIMVPATGAQAFGSAQSYVLKQFLRGLFFIATGEKDADADEARPLPTGRSPSPAQEAKPRDAAAPVKAAEPVGDGAKPATPTGPVRPAVSAEEHADLNKRYNEIRLLIAEAKVPLDIAYIREQKTADMKLMREKGFGAAADKLEASIKAREAQLNVAPADDDIPFK